MVLPPKPTCPDELWTMDFEQDAFMNGRKFRTLNLMDGFTREALEIEADTSLPGERVKRVLEGLKQQGRKPEAIVIDNGPEFISQVVDQWTSGLTKTACACTSSRRGDRWRTATLKASTASSATSV